MSGEGFMNFKVFEGILVHIFVCWCGEEMPLLWLLQRLCSTVCVHQKEDIWYLLWLQVDLISKRFNCLKKSQNSVCEYQLISCEKLP